jgi:hypothetical protein
MCTGCALLDSQKCDTEGKTSNEASCNARENAYWCPTDLPETTTQRNDNTETELGMEWREAVVVKTMNKTLFRDPNMMDGANSHHEHIERYVEVEFKDENVVVPAILVRRQHESEAEDATLIGTKVDVWMAPDENLANRSQVFDWRTASIVRMMVLDRQSIQTFLEHLSRLRS